ncbi:PAS domain S-box-containing protein [Azospirillum brasilense]|uniref:histidine kinase n=1 Tax=Azospirillum brasilense TaxID=192 RepID=A0A560CQP0_AZOBR|nr:PAS domain-containing protein [Azospirillum brasilense]TWA87178.1 PAS domain S-box-containing protein [Azospirillum brasilense]
MRLRLPFVALLALLPLVAFAVAAIMLVDRQQERSVEELVRHATDAAVRTVDGRVLMTRSALEIMSSARSLDIGDRNVWKERSERALRQRPDWVALEVRDRQGMVTLLQRPQDPDAGRIDPAARAAQADRVFRSGESWVGGVIRDPTGTVEPVFAVSVPVWGVGEVRLVLTAYVRAWSLRQVLIDQVVTPSWVGALLDRDGRIVARTRSETAFDPAVGQPAPDTLVRPLRSGEEFFLAHTRLGEEILSAKAGSIAASGWLLALGTPAEPIQAAARRTIYTVAGGGLGALAIAALVAWTLARSHARREAAEQRARVAEAAAEADRRSHAILESTTDGVYEIDRSWRIVYMNGRARGLMGGSSDLTGQRLWEAFPDAMGTVLWDRLLTAMRDRHPDEFEAYFAPLGVWLYLRVFPSSVGLAIYFQDISKRLLAERALERAVEQANQILESIGDAFYAIDRDWRITYVNKRAQEMFDRTRVDLVGRCLLDLFPEVAGNTIIRTFEAAMADQQPREFEALSGIFQRWTMFNVYPQAGGGLSIYFRDVSAHRAAEAALRASEQRYRTLLEALPQMVWTCRADGGCDFLSRQWLSYTGQTMEEGRGNGWSAVIHPDDRERMFAVWMQAVEKRTTYDTEARIRSVDGTYRWFKQCALPIVDPETGEERWFGTSTDITDMFEARTAMQAAKEEAEQVGLRFRTLADSIPQLAWMARPDGRIFWYNRRWRDYTGVEGADSANGPLWDGILPADHADRVTASLQRSFRTGEPWEDTFPMAGRDGAFRWFLSRALPVRDSDGAIVLWFGTNTDVTDRLESEEALRRAKEEAERAALSKSKFLASASHDLRQPMQSLFLFSGALHGHVQSEKGQKALRLLESGLDALKGLLDSLLDVSRLDAGVVKPTLEDFPMALLLDHIAAGYAPVARGKGLDWTMEGCPLNIRSDRVLLGRMIRNLVENAIRYTEQGNIAITCSVVDGRMRITVADTGIGISDEHLPRIFEEFHQVGNPERDRSQGLGLGLAIVQRIGLLLEHPVTVRSTPGVGSVFTIEVPLGETPKPVDLVPAVHPLATRPVAAGGGEERLAMVIDDDSIVLLGLQAILREWGYEVLIAGSGEQAVDKLRSVSRKPDIIIADYRLREGKVGTDAILDIRRLFDSEIPAIVVTGETGPECQRDAVRHGFGLMHKPVTPRQLAGAMERSLQLAE